jgi:S-adenosyl-L-methionine hydrolase (adenosine-forming)
VEELRVVDLPGPMVTPGVVGGRVVGVDGFGNVQLNVTGWDLDAAGLSGGVTLAVGSRRVPLVATFSDVAAGTPAAIIDSQGFVALTINRGSAAETLGLRRGDSVVLVRADGEG